MKRPNGKLVGASRSRTCELQAHVCKSSLVCNQCNLVIHIRSFTSRIMLNSATEAKVDGNEQMREGGQVFL